MRRSSRDVSDSIQRQSDGLQLYSRKQMPQVQFQSVKQKQIPVQRVYKNIEIPQLQLVQETMRSESRHMTPGLSTKQPEFEASSVSGMRFERSSFPLRSSRQWRCRPKPSTANVRSACRSEEDSRAKSTRRNEEQPERDSVEEHPSVQDPGTHAHPKQKRARDQQAKGLENQRSEELQQIRS